MKIILVDGEESLQLYPLTMTKPIGELRMGILTFKERWEKLSNQSVDFWAQDYLQVKYPVALTDDDLFVNPCFFATADLVEAILALEPNEALMYNNQIVASRGKTLDHFQTKKEYTKDLIYLAHPWDLFTHNAFAIAHDYQLLTQGRKSQPLSDTNRCLHSENIFLEEGAVVEFAILNASEGPIYIGENAEIMEGSMVRGSLALCESAKLNLGTKIYPGTTIGPHCKVGGEVNNSILMGYSNKGHDGFLGNSVIGEWCNLGADTNNSNLKNNYGEVKVWSYKEERFVQTGLQFCGLMMGDHSKSAINTQFNTGTVVGICANVFDAGFPPTNVKSFTWGGKKDAPVYQLDRAYDAADRMMQRRKQNLNDADKEILKYLFEKHTK